MWVGGFFNSGTFYQGHFLVSKLLLFVFSLQIFFLHTEIVTFSPAE